MKHIIVLTGTVDPSIAGVDVKVADKTERLNQYLQNIRKIASETKFDIIIFGENSNFQFDYSEIIEFVREKGKELEIIKFMGNNKEIQKRGKGVGEAEVLNTVLEKSRFLQNQEQTFYKITGRIFIKNMNNIIENSLEENYFNRWNYRKNEVDTRFFKCSVKFFKENLFELISKIDDFSNNSIEEVYFSNIKGNIKINSFSTYPIVTGICASLGKKYDLPWYKLFLMKFQTKFGMLELKNIR